MGAYIADSIGDVRSIRASNDAMGRVVLTDGISRVVLTPAGPPALGFRTRIEVAGGPFSASIEAEAWDYTRFIEALRRLHETLVGEANLTFVEGGHSITLTGIGRGGVEARFVVSDGQSPCNAFLTVRMTLDQRTCRISSMPFSANSCRLRKLTKLAIAFSRLTFLVAKALNAETEKIAKVHGRNERALERA